MLYGFLAILILSSSYLLWWRPAGVHAITVAFSSSDVWTVPANVSSAFFELWGGGGPGGGASTNSTAGGGGGGGGYCNVTTSVTPTTNYSITVALATPGGTGSGITGDDSYVQDPSLSQICRASGGGGGGANNGTGGMGGIGISGDVIFTGGSGAAGSGSSGGGGGAAGVSGNGGSASGQTGGTGISPNGGTGGTGLPSGTNATGNTGGTYGGGGSGGVKKSGASQTGGTGAQGLVTVTYTPDAATYTQSNYQLFANADSTTPGSTLAAMSSPATLSSTGQAFRLRQLIKPNQTISSGAQTFNEQYADLSSFGSCSAISSGSWNSLSQTAISSALTAGSGADDSSTGTIAWTNPGNITALDGSTANSTLTARARSHYLDATNFGFSIPTGATINGITVSVVKDFNGFGNTIDNAARLIKGGTIQATDRSNLGSWPSLTLTPTSYGTSSDLWGGSWTPSDINDPSFGFAISGDNTDTTNTSSASIDNIQITVYYTPTNLFAYNDNTTPASGDAITYQAGTDPTDSGTYTAQTYQEADNFGITNSIAANTDGEWDLSLKDNGAPAGTTYCFRTVKSDGTPLDTYSFYPQITTASANSPPGTPTLSTPASGATSVSTTPSFTLSTTDPDSDSVKYRIYLYQSDCSTVVGASPFAQVSSGTGWDNGTTAYTSGATATYTYQGILTAGTTYCWKADAIDPAGTNTYSSTSATQSFTTASATSSVNIGGGVDIRGGSTIQ